MNTTRKRVFIFVPSNGKIGGAERRITRSMDIIANQTPNIEFLIGLLHIESFDESKVLEDYKEFTQLPFMFFSSKWKLFKFVQKSSFDCVIYTDCSYRCLPVLAGAFVSKKKRIMICANTLGSSQNLSWIKQQLYNIDIKFSDRIDCLYPYGTQLLKRIFKNKRITCTPCSFTDLNKFKPNPVKEKKIVFLGRIINIKGADLFVQSAISVCDELRKNGYKCEIYGFGDLENNLKDLVKKNRCNDVIIFNGHIEDSAEVLSTSIAFCSLQTYGNYPSQSLLEALACGNYCIVTDTYDSELLVPDDCGTLVEQDTESIAKAMSALINTPIESINTSANTAREFIMQNHTAERSAEYYKELLNEVLNM